MARVTVEDCILVIPNRFRLAVLASHRAKQLSCGAIAMCKTDGDKSTVTALREIGQKSLNEESLMSEILKKYERFSQDSSSDDSDEIESIIYDEISEDSANCMFDAKAAMDFDLSSTVTKKVTVEDDEED
jgi:DNA-directed RNA polymerase subunit omega